MTDLPQHAKDHLLQSVLAERHMACLEFGTSRKLEGIEGDLEWFGLETLSVGDDLQGRFDFMQGFASESESGNQLLPRMELVPGRSTDIHLLPQERGHTLLFLDVTAEASRERHFQQKGNELSLALRSWGVAVFERVSESDFRLLGLAPSWMRSLGFTDQDAHEIVERLPFLESFVEEAADIWNRGGNVTYWSDNWAEEDTFGRECFLEANATVLEDGRRLLVVQSSNRRSQERQRILTEARRLNLDLEGLRAEVDKKEVLLHCIIHDLKGPLAGMIGSMALIKKPNVEADKKEELLTLGLEQARHQETMIRGLLDAFTADVQALEQFETEASEAPDLFECVESALRTYTNAYAERGVELKLSPAATLEPPCKICGDEGRLERVLGNLLENALRHSPPSGEVDVLLSARGDGYRLQVEDQGPGVPEELVPDLFKKFSRGRERSGTGGLGLYFCRSTVTKWGGSIGYEPKEGGGSRFWIELEKAR